MAQGPIRVEARKPDGETLAFNVTIDARTDAEVAALLQGGAFRATLERALAL